MVSGNKSWTCQPCYLKFMQELPFHSASSNSSQAENLNLSAVSEVSEQVADVRKDFSFLRKEYRKEFNIASYNINSLQSKFVEVKEWLDQGVFDVLTIQETKIDRTYPNFQFQVEHYKAVKERFTKLCEETHGNQRKFWGTISPYINSRKKVNIGRIMWDFECIFYWF